MNSIATLFFAVLLVAGGAAAQSYPSGPIRMVVPFTVGSATDILARLIGPKLFESWGQQIVVDNRPSAGGTVAGVIVAGATPEEFDKLVRNEIVMCGKVFKASGARPD